LKLNGHSHRAVRGHRQLLHVHGEGIDLGGTPKRLQTVMGHASIAMTFDRYGHLFADHDTDREAMKKLQAAVLAA
jgi:integrase